MYRTDLAKECCERAGITEKLPEGISFNKYEYKSIGIEKVKITTEEAAKLIGKPMGEYITVITPDFAMSTALEEDEIEKIADELYALMPKSGTTFVAGLGNSDITPDAIGPNTVHQVVATRHIDIDYAKQIGLEGLTSTAVITPGVLGQTGIEASEMVAAVTEKIKPACVIVIDALAAGSIERLGNTIQISNTGISPGSGVMNARKELSHQTLGVPVISIGIPTVVDAETMAEEILGLEEQSLADKSCEYQARKKMMVTPRDIDQLVGHACKTLALIINRSLQRNLPMETISYLMS